MSMSTQFFLTSIRNSCQTLFFLIVALIWLVKFLILPFYYYNFKVLILTDSFAAIFQSKNAFLFTPFCPCLSKLTDKNYSRSRDNYSILTIISHFFRKMFCFFKRILQFFKIFVIFYKKYSTYLEHFINRVSKSPKNSLAFQYFCNKKLEIFLKITQKK